jgi:hypothetical protein
MLRNGQIIGAYSLTTHMFGQVGKLPPEEIDIRLTHFSAWSGGRDIDEFIKISQEGRAKGDHIMHRENGTLVDLNLGKKRAIGKMKATITQRFSFDGTQVDVECDCRFIFFCKQEGDAWKVQYVRLFYEKDKMISVDGSSLPTLNKEILAKYPEGYRYLGFAQESIGQPVLKDLPTMEGEGFFKMYEVMHNWMEGKEVNMFWN